MSLYLPSRTLDGGGGVGGGGFGFAVGGGYVGVIPIQVLLLVSG